MASIILLSFHRTDPRHAGAKLFRMYSLGTAWGILLEEKEDEEFACPEKTIPTLELFRQWRRGTVPSGTTHGRR